MKLPRREMESEIPTSSMADIAFLLIIFFMVTTVHEVDRTSVNLPLAKIREEAEKGSAFVVLGKMKSGDTEQLIYKFSDGEAMSKVISGPRCGPSARIAAAASGRMAPMKPAAKFGVISSKRAAASSGFMFS